MKERTIFNHITEKLGDHLYTILRSFNVLITGHQGFLTNEALEELREPLLLILMHGHTMAPLKTNLDDSFQIIIQTTHVIGSTQSLKYTIAFFT
jgi:hypothetical protein